MSNPDTKSFPHVPEHYRCLGCDYVLARLEVNRCPECGRAFDPNDRRTMNTVGKPFPAVARFLYRSPGPILLLLLTAPILFTAWEYRRPGGDFNAQAGGLALWLLCGGIWFVRLVVFIAIGVSYRRPASEAFRRAWRWGALPIALVGWFIVIGSSDAIQHAAFGLSRDRLEAMAQRGSTGPAGERAGVLWVRSVDPYDGGTLLMTGTGYDACPYGYAWFPSGKPTDTQTLHFHPFEGQWYTFRAASRSDLPAKPAAGQTAPQPLSPH